MKDYGQFCPLAQAARILCERWTMIIVRELIAGSTRFSELQQGVPGISPSLLSTRLKELEQAGIIIRQGGKLAEYHLTQAGKELRPIVEYFGAWGHRWARSDLRDGDLSAGLLMWDIRRSVNPQVFPSNQIVVQFEFPDASAGNKDWWLISKAGQIDLCLDDPNLDVDILIRCSLKTMTAIWTCQSGFDDEVGNGEVEVLGDEALKPKLQSWLCSSLLSRLGTVETMPAPPW